MRSPVRFCSIKKARLIKLYKKPGCGMNLLRLLSPTLTLFCAGFLLPSTNYFLYLHHQKTFTMRKKEGLADYRYFPEPDLPEVVLTSGYINEISKSMPELPEAKRRRYENMGLSMQDVLFLANDDNVRFHLLCWCMCVHRLFRSSSFMVWSLTGYTIGKFHFIRLGRGSHICYGSLLVVHRNYFLLDKAMHSLYCSQ